MKCLDVDYFNQIMDEEDITYDARGVSPRRCNKQLGENSCSRFGDAYELEEN
jgi:hypothetical protein